MGLYTIEVKKTYDLENQKSRHNGESCTYREYVNNGGTEAVQNADRVRGEYPHLKQYDHLIFPDASQLLLFPVKWGKATTPTMTTTCYNDRQGKWIDVPASIFCKLSTEDAENELLYDDENNPFGQLMLPSMLDSKRIGLLAGKVLEVTNVVKLKTAGFTFDETAQKWIINKFDPEKADSLNVYMFKELDVDVKF